MLKEKRGPFGYEMRRPLFKEMHLASYKRLQTPSAKHVRPFWYRFQRWKEYKENRVINYQVGAVSRTAAVERGTSWIEGCSEKAEACHRRGSGGGIRSCLITHTKCSGSERSTAVPTSARTALLQPWDMFAELRNPFQRMSTFGMFSWDVGYQDGISPQ